MSEQRRVFLTPPEVAAMVGVSEATLKRWRARGTGPAHFTFGRAVRYYARDLDAWIAQRRG